MSLTEVFAPITKRVTDPETGHLTVFGKVSGGDLDLDGQRMDPEWLKGAMPDWFKAGANVRQMHQPIAVGKGVELTEDPGDGWWLSSKVVDGKAIELVNEGILTGYSIGIKQPRVIKDASGTAPHGVIVGGIIVETSLVDRPCLPSAKFVMAKSAGNDTIEPTAEWDEHPVEMAKAADVEPDPTRVEDAPEVVEAAVEKVPVSDTVKALLADLPKMGSEASDIRAATKAIGEIAKLIAHEAEGLANGEMCEAEDISDLLDAVAALRHFISREEMEASGRAGTGAGSSAMPAKTTMKDAMPEEVVTPEESPTTPDFITKAEVASMVKAEIAESTKPYAEKIAALEGDLEKALAQPVAGGPVLTRTAGQTTTSKVKDELLAKAARFRSMAVSIQDQTMAKGYHAMATETEASAAQLPE